jgi:S1-C subfamily serine protease
MNPLKNVVLAAILLMACCQVVLLAESSTSIEHKDALVLLIRRSFMGRGAGNGFVIGDGTLVVTAHHLVFEESEQGQHEMSGRFL